VSNVYKVVEAEISHIDQILTEWKPLLDAGRYMTLQTELELERPLYVIVDDNFGDFLAVFDVLPARDQNKTLKIFFSPKIAGQEGLTSESVDEIQDLLVFIFTHIFARAFAEEGVTGAKIRSDDIILLAAFRGFASTLASMGFCSVKSYGKWIQIDDLKSAVVEPV